MFEKATVNGWLGEVQGLQTSFDAAATKLVALDRMRERTTGPVGLGIRSSPRMIRGDTTGAAAVMSCSRSVAHDPSRK